VLFIIHVKDSASQENTKLVSEGRGEGLKLPICTLTTVTWIATWQNGLYSHKVKVIKTLLSKYYW